jgi:hypothetical protein
MSNCNKTLQQTVNFASTHADLLPLAGVGGYTDEPALTLCNDVLSDLISDPSDWVFNRVEMQPVFTCSGKQDYLFAGASAFVLGVTPTPSAVIAPSMGWAIDLASNSAITVSGGVVTVNTLEVHRFTAGSTVYMTGNGNTNYNSNFTDNGTVSQWNGGWTITSIPSPTSFTFTATAGQNSGDITGAPGITDFGYATSASLQELNNNSSPPNIYPATVYRELPYTSRVAQPEKVAVMADLGTGVLKIRFAWIPSWTVFSALIVYQAKAPTKVALTDSWSPFPDNFSVVYQQGLIYRMYRYLGDARADNEYKKLQAEIAKVQEADSASPSDTGMRPDSLMDGGTYYDWY